MNYRPRTPWAREDADPRLRAAAHLAVALGEEHGWAHGTVEHLLRGLAAVLDGHPDGEPVTLSQVHLRATRSSSKRRIAQVLDGIGLLTDDTTPAIRSWIDRRSGQLPEGFQADVRAWLLWLLDGDDRTRPRSQAALYTYFGSVKPHLEALAPERGRLREITAADLRNAVKPLSGHQLRNAVCALRSLFRFAKKRGLTFADPARRLKAPDVRDIGRVLLPMTDQDIQHVELTAATPAQRLVVALAAVHAARATPIRMLTLDDLDLAERRITIDGHNQRIGDLVHRLLLAWLDHRRATWPHTANRHLLISQQTALGTEPVTHYYLKKHLLLRGVHLERIRGDRILQEALAVGPDPLHLTVVFNLSFDTAMTYTRIAAAILDSPVEPAAEPPGVRCPDPPINGEISVKGLQSR